MAYFLDNNKNHHYILSIDSVIIELNKAKNSKLDPFDKKIAMEKAHKHLSRFLFDAVARQKYDDIAKILSQPIVIKKELTDKDGRTILEHLIVTANNDVFFGLHKSYSKYIAPYLHNIPELFILALSKKNYKVVEYILRNGDFNGALRKEHIANVLFVAIEGRQEQLTGLVARYYAPLIDVRSIEATMIYFIANSKMPELEMTMQYDNLMQKFTPVNVEKMLAYAVMNRNADALKIMLANPHFARVVERGDPNMQKSILNLLNYNNRLLRK